MSTVDYMQQITGLANTLIKEESCTVNSVLPQDNMLVNKGWQCPIYGRVYSPSTPMCFYCGGKGDTNEDIQIGYTGTCI